MTGRVLRLPANEHGRDFVLGDIHGAYDLVIDGMRKMRFDGSVDRILAVGDLIDRGPQSHRVLGFLQQPYVHAVRGNHDHDFCELSINEIRVLGEVNWNGMGWVRDQSDEHLLAIQQAMMKLPIAMEIDSPRGLVGLVHADVPKGMSWQAFIAAIEAGREDVIEVALCGRDRLQARDDSGVEGVGRLFVGHTIQWDGPQQLGNVYAVDSGAVFQVLGKEKGSMTMVNALARTGLLVAGDRPAGEPLMLISGAHSEPFGHYVRPRP